MQPRELITSTTRSLKFRGPEAGCWALAHSEPGESAELEAHGRAGGFGRHARRPKAGGFRVFGKGAGCGRGDGALDANAKADLETNSPPENRLPVELPAAPICSVRAAEPAVNFSVDKQLRSWPEPYTPTEQGAQTGCPASKHHYLGPLFGAELG